MRLPSMTKLAGKGPPSCNTYSSFWRRDLVKPRTVACARPKSDELSLPAMVPPRAAILPTVSHSCLDQGPGLDHRHPFIFIKSKSSKLKPRAKIDPLFRGPIRMNRVYQSVDLFHSFFFRKLILKFPEIPSFGDLAVSPIYFILFMFWSLKFYKNSLKLFQNHIFAHVILHLSSCIHFYNYD
jgi:hypothetical protein